MRLWCVINMAKIEGGGFSRGQVVTACGILPIAYAPTCFYEDRRAAETELMRLAEKYPDEGFCLFEAVSLPAG